MPDILDYSPNVKVETEGNFVGTGDPKLHNLNNINNDDYNQKLSTAQSMSVGAYELANFIPNDCGQKKARNIQTSQVGINFGAGHEGGKNGCLMDTNNNLKFEELTNKNYLSRNRVGIRIKNFSGLMFFSWLDNFIPGRNYRNNWSAMY